MTKMSTIMKKTYLFFLAALTLGFAACDNYFDSKYLDNARPEKTAVETYYYELTSEDYKTIANNKTNKAYAESLDTIEGQTTNQDALALVAQQMCFNEIATADMYIPAFIKNLYPQVDKGSTFVVTYNTDEGQPAYIKYYNATIQYKLTDKDYKKIWGNDTIKYLTPEKEANFVDYANMPQVDDDYLVGIKYNFAEAVGEPVSEKEVLYIFKDGYKWEQYSADGLYLLPTEANGMVIKWLEHTFPYAQADDQVTVMVYNGTKKSYQATDWVFTGIEWEANTGLVPESMSFVLGDTWEANLSTYYKQAVAGDGNMGKITLHHYDLEDGITYIWIFDNSYGMKGTAYKSGPHYGEGWFVLPSIKLKNATAPALSFDHAINYGPTIEDGRMEQVSVWVSTDYTDEPRTATWTQLPWNEWDGTYGVPDANSWTFYNSGRMDLSEWNGKTITIGFRYKSVAGQTCSTWEVKNILVNEPEGEE